MQFYGKQFVAFIFVHNDEPLSVSMKLYKQY